jgi:hypothetical protein
MAQGNQPVLEQAAGTPAGWDLIDDIRATLHGFEPHSKAEEQLYSEGLDQVGKLGDARSRESGDHSLVSLHTGDPTLHPDR